MRRQLTLLILSAALLVAAAAALSACGGGGSGPADGAPGSVDTGLPGDVPDGAGTADGGPGTSETAGGTDTAGSDTPGGPDSGHSDTGGTPGGCTYTTDCDAPQVCRDGACVDPCPGNPCPTGWTCNEEAGVCWQQCFTSEDCTQQGFRCEGQRRCVPGCPWHPHYCAGDAQCDPVHGECTPGFCVAEFSELSPATDRVFLGPVEPGTAPEGSFTINVSNFLPEGQTRSLGVRLLDVSDDQVALTGAGRIEGENVVPVELPVQVSRGERYVVGVQVSPTSFGGAYGQVEIVSDGTVCVNNPVYILTLGAPDCVAAQPAMVQAGAVAWGDIAKHRVRLRNDCDRPVKIVAWNFIATQTDWMVAEDYVGTALPADGGTLDFEIFFAPTLGAPGGVVRNTKLLVVFDDPANRVLELTLEGSGID